jgi:rfaE bifunctional protein kinase chain/domain
MGVKEDVYRGIQTEFQKRGIVLALDSRFRIKRFKGMTVATPNEPELESVFQTEIDKNDGLLHELGQRLRRETEAEAILVTRGSKGMVLFEDKKSPRAIPISGTTDIVDVTGAGDTVISVYTLALSCGATHFEAAHLANLAGGLVVMKKGTAVVTAEELKKAAES